VVDRIYFKSVYAREPGGLLVEVATVGPGMAVDEDPEVMGIALALPPWLEPHRTSIEARLTPIHNPRTHG
jgi:glyoxalase family protein